MLNPKYKQYRQRSYNTAVKYQTEGKLVTDDICIIFTVLIVLHIR